MTLEEKAAQLTGVWYADLLVEGQLDDERMTQHLSHGIGQITRIAGTGFDPVPAAEAIDRIQHFLEDRSSATPATSACRPSSWTSSRPPRPRVCRRSSSWSAGEPIPSPGSCPTPQPW
jgi:hypothetical protein